MYSLETGCLRICLVMIFAYVRQFLILHLLMWIPCLKRKKMWMEECDTFKLFFKVRKSFSLEEKVCSIEFDCKICVFLCLFWFMSFYMAHTFAAFSKWFLNSLNRILFFKLDWEKVGEVYHSPPRLKKL